MRSRSVVARRSRKLSRAAVPEVLESRTLLSFTPTPITQYHVDVQSTGVNANETLLTPSTVNVSQFGKQFSTPVDGQIFAEPLYVPNVGITSGPLQGVHNVVYAATEHDSLYAIDSTGGNVLWKVSFQSVETPGNATGAVTLLNPMGATAMAPFPSSESGSGDLTPEIGITATPVIDLPNNAIYVVAKTKQTIAGVATNYVQVLYKLDIRSGAILASKVIGDTIYSGGNYTYVTSGNAADTPYVVGTGDGNITVSGQKRVYFNSLREFGRVALSLFNGVIYMGFASHSDTGPYHGWMLGYSASNLAITGALNTTPNGGLGGIWQGGGTIEIDPAANGGTGAFYFETGNGSFNTAASNFSGTHSGSTTWFTGLPKDSDYGDSVVKVLLDGTTSPTHQNTNGWGLKIVDFFSPYNNAQLNSADTDLGSSGISLLPDAVGSAATPHLLVASGKEGKLYLINRDDMSGFDSTTDHAKQVVAGVVSGVLNSPAFFLDNPSPGSGQSPSGSLLVVAGYGGGAWDFKISNGAISGPTSNTTNDFGYLPGSPSISANGTSNGILWAINRNTNKLYAYRADNLGVELWDSGQAPGNRDLLGTATKFSVATVADGQVFAGTSNALVVYGPPVPPTAPPTAPANLTGSAPYFNTVNLSWADLSTNEDSFRIERTTTPGDASSWVEVGSVSTNVTAYADATALANTTYAYRVRAYNIYLGGSYSAYSNTFVVETPDAPKNGTGDGLAANYYSDSGATSDGHLSGPPMVTETDPTIDFDWGSGSPVAGIPADHFSVRWVGTIVAPVGGLYTFSMTSDDGDRLYIDGALVINHWVDHSSATDTYRVGFTAGSQHTVRMEMYEATVDAIAKLHWNYPNQADTAVTFAGGGATGTYYDDTLSAGAHLGGSAIVNPALARVDPTVDSTTRWLNGDPDGPGTALAGNTNFSALWTGQVQAQYTENYTFTVLADDGVRLWVNGQLLANSWVTQGTTAFSGTIALSAGQKYSIMMEYFQGNGGYYAQLRWSSPSTPDQVIPQSQLYSGVAPAAPTNLAGVAASGTQVNLTWADNATNENGYLVQRSDAGGPFASIVSLPPNATAYMDTALVPDTDYQYRVVATNFAANSPYSNVFSITTPIPPNKPTNAHPTAITPHAIAFSWTDTADNEDGYRITREIGDSDIVIAQLPPNSTSYVDTGANGLGLTPGTSYEYHIQAYNVAGYNDFTGFNIPTLTLAPASLTATPGVGKVSLAWAAVSASVPVTYTVYRGTTPGGESATPLASGLESPSFTDASAQGGTTYYYTVTADDSNDSNDVFGLPGESAPSAEAAALAQNPAPRVVQFEVGSSKWSPAFLAYLSAHHLGADGYAVPAGAAQGNPLPWLNIDEVKVSFDQPVTVASADLKLTGINLAQYGVASFSYDAPSMTATWKLTAAIGPDRLTALLADSVVNSTGAALDGEWTNGAGAFPSGNGVPGSPFNFAFNVLPGDVNQNGSVSDDDLGLVRASQALTASSATYNLFQDVNGSGGIFADDLILVRNAEGTGLPAKPLVGLPRPMIRLFASPLVLPPSVVEVGGALA